MLIYPIAAAVIPLAQQLLPVSDAEFESIDELDTKALSRKIRTMRTPKISGFVVLANTDTIARLTNAVTRLEKCSCNRGPLFVFLADQ